MILYHAIMPGINKYYTVPEIVEMIKRLKRASRREALK